MPHLQHLDTMCLSTFCCYLWTNGGTVTLTTTNSLGLAIWHHFEFNFILNLYILSMCFVHYCNWIICTVYKVVLMLFFILRKFWWEFQYSPCTPGTYAAVLGYTYNSSIQLIWSSSFAAKIWCGCWSHWHWVIPEILLCFFLAKFSLIASTSMLSYSPLATSPLP